MTGDGLGCKGSIFRGNWIEYGNDVLIHKIIRGLVIIKRISHPS